MAEQDKKQKYSFAELFRKQSDGVGYRIEIPMIQRDYAQGRISDKVTDLRNDFVSALSDYLKDDTETHELDFVYGSSEYIDKTTRKFIPLDGQQRLTTLFLLHWYLSQRAYGTEASNKFTQLIANGIAPHTTSNFAYRTRRSSTDFCNELIGLLHKPIDFNNLKTIRIIENGKEVKVPSVAKTIRNLSWYSPMWDNDPTIKSMLVMLEELHKTFNNIDHKQYLLRLLDEQKPAIGFTFMDLDEYKLTEDLYIKMNSRGKPLTSFENFKAKFEQRIGEVENDAVFSDKKEDIAKRFDEKLSPINSVKQYFSFNIDTKWTNFFWAYCLEELKSIKEEEREAALENKLDSKIANFIRVILTNALAITEKKSINKTILVEKNKSEVSFNQYQKENALTPFGINLLIDALDAVSNGNSKLKSVIPTSYFFNEDEVIEKTMNNDLEYVMRVRLHAYLIFLAAFGKNKPKELEAWMRFAYNLTHAPNLEAPITADNVYIHLSAFTKLMGEMVEKGISNIDDYLLTKTYSEDLGFQTSQEKEEIIKAHLREIRPTDEINWTMTIDKFENHAKDSYFSGQIEFLFDMAGIQQYFETNGNCCWDSQTNKRMYESFCKYGDIALEIFKGGYDARVYAADAILERAMIAMHPEYLDSTYNLLNSTQNGYNIRRDLSWKRLLHTDHSLKMSARLKELFDKVSVSDESTLTETLHSQLEKIIKDHQPYKAWQKVLVNSGSILGYSNYGFISCLYGQHILHAKKRMSWGDKEVFTIDLYTRKIEGQESKFPDMDICYQSAHISYCYPYIKATFKFGGFKHILKLEHNPENNDFGNYFLSVYVINSQNQITSGLEDALINIGFTPLENNSNVLLLHLDRSLSEDEILNKYREIFSSLNQKEDSQTIPMLFEENEQPAE
ncbi:MAG: DUF262 domain-containing protein [Muribaculum sp.]|nr:DUF262 domain-containing protein [Muribaculum sp.]